MEGGNNHVHFGSQSRKHNRNHLHVSPASDVKYACMQNNLLLLLFQKLGDKQRSDTSEIDCTGCTRNSWERLNQSQNG